MPDNLKPESMLMLDIFVQTPLPYYSPLNLTATKKSSLLSIEVLGSSSKKEMAPKSPKIEMEASDVPSCCWLDGHFSGFG